MILIDLVLLFLKIIKIYCSGTEHPQSAAGMQLWLANIEIVGQQLILGRFKTLSTIAKCNDETEEHLKQESFFKCSWRVAVVVVAITHYFPHITTGLKQNNWWYLNIFQSTLCTTCVSHSCCWSCIWCVAHPRESSIFLSISNLSEIVSGTHLIYPHHQRTLWNMRDTHEQCHTLCISTKNLFLSNISKSFLDNNVST